MNKLTKQMNKLNKGDDDEEDEEEEEEKGFGGNGAFPPQDLTAFERFRVSALRKLDEEGFGAVNAEYDKERIALETKYLGLRAPLYEQRAKIIAGTVPVPQVDSESTEEGTAPVPAPGAFLYAIPNPNNAFPFLTTGKIIFPKSHRRSRQGH